MTKRHNNSPTQISWAILGAGFPYTTPKFIPWKELLANSILCPENGSFSMMGQVGKFANFVVRLWKFGSANTVWGFFFFSNMEKPFFCVRYLLKGFSVLLDVWEKSSLNIYLQVKDKMTQMAGWSALSLGKALFFIFSCASWLVILQFTWVYPR